VHLRLPAVKFPIRVHQCPSVVKIIFHLDSQCPTLRAMLTRIMGYLIELDDLRKHVRYPAPGDRKPEHGEKIPEPIEAPTKSQAGFVQPELILETE